MHILKHVCAQSCSISFSISFTNMSPTSNRNTPCPSPVNGTPLQVPQHITIASADSLMPLRQPLSGFPNCPTLPRPVRNTVTLSKYCRLNESFQTRLAARHLFCIYMPYHTFLSLARAPGIFRTSSSWQHQPYLPTDYQRRYRSLAAEEGQPCPFEKTSICVPLEHSNLMQSSSDNNGLRSY